VSLLDIGLEVGVIDLSLGLEGLQLPEVVLRGIGGTEKLVFFLRISDVEVRRLELDGRYRGFENGLALRMVSEPCLLLRKLLFGVVSKGEMGALELNCISMSLFMGYESTCVLEFALRGYS
jgi:hypothetical protein